MLRTREPLACPRKRWHGRIVHTNGRRLVTGTFPMIQVLSPCRAMALGTLGRQLRGFETPWRRGWSHCASPYPCRWHLGSSQFLTDMGEGAGQLHSTDVEDRNTERFVSFVGMLSFPSIYVRKAPQSLPQTEAWARMCNTRYRKRNEAHRKAAATERVSRTFARHRPSLARSSRLWKGTPRKWVLRYVEFASLIRAGQHAHRLHPRMG